MDVISGGTWLAIRTDGSFVAVTNQRALDPAPPGLRSRGLAVRELAEARDRDAYVAALDPRRYASMNLVWGDADRVSIAYCRQPTGEREVEELAPGVHVLCNDRIGAAGFPRGERLQAAVINALAESSAWPQLSLQLAIAIGDHTRVPLVDVPPSHLAPELARELTATCIHSEHYGTRSASVVAIERGRVAGYLHADGPPCTTPFEDLRSML